MLWGCETLPRVTFTFAIIFLGEQLDDKAVSAITSPEFTELYFPAPETPPNHLRLSIHRDRQANIVHVANNI